MTAKRKGGILVRILGVWGSRACCRLCRDWLFLKVLLCDHVVTGANSFARAFDLFAIKNQRRSLANHLDYKTIRSLGESLCEIVQSCNLFTVYLVDNAGPVRCEISVRWIWQDIR